MKHVDKSQQELQDLGAKSLYQSEINGGGSEWGNIGKKKRNPSEKFDQYHRDVDEKYFDRDQQQISKKVNDPGYGEDIYFDDEEEYGEDSLYDSAKPFIQE